MKKKNVVEQMQDATGGSLNRLGMRPSDATHDALRKMMGWLDACRKLGWSEDTMPKLEGMFWQYYDKDGNKKPHTEKLCHGVAERKT